MPRDRFVRYHPATGGRYVRIKYAPVNDDGRKLRARWAWAVQIGGGRFPRYLLLNQKSQNLVPDKVKKGSHVETKSYLIGRPLEVRPAAMNLHYARLEVVDK